MKYMRILLCLLALVFCLGACAAPEAAVVEPPAEELPAEELPAEETAPVTEPEMLLPEIPPLEPAEAHLYYESGGRSLLLDRQGQILRAWTDCSVSFFSGIQWWEPLGVQVLHQEGQVETEGGYEPERQWVDLYDLQGNLLLEQIPAKWVSCYGQVLYCYGMGAASLRRLSDGAVICDAVERMSPGDGFVAYQQTVRTPIELLDFSGEHLGTLDAGMELVYTVDVRGGCLLVQGPNGTRMGLVDLEGRTVLPSEYSDILNVTEHRAVTRRSGRSQVLDLDTGAVLFESTGDIYLATGQCVEETRESSRVLIDLEGNQLYPETFMWSEVLTWNAAGEADLLCLHGSDQDYLVRPDGTEVFAMDRVFFDCLVGDRWAFVRNHDDSQIWCGLVDLETGQMYDLTAHLDRQYQYLESARFSQPEDGVPQHYLLAGYTNVAGSVCWELLDVTGHVYLRDLQSADKWYDEWVGMTGGVVNCRRGFTKGLLAADGHWLYSESLFDSLGRER